MRGGMPTDGSRHRKARLRSDGELVSADNGTFAVKFERDLLCRVVRELVGADSVVSEYVPLGLGTRMRTSQPLRAASARAWLLGAERPGVLRCRALSRARRDCVPRLAVKGRGRFGPRSREMRQSGAAGSVRWGGAFLDSSDRRMAVSPDSRKRSLVGLAGSGAALRRTGWAAGTCHAASWASPRRPSWRWGSGSGTPGCGVRETGVSGPGDCPPAFGRPPAGLRDDSGSWKA